jgi:hypothetical protein
MQMVIDVFAQIFGTLWAHKLRSFLTMFGIAWESVPFSFWLASEKASEPATSATSRSTGKTSS